jgi:F420-dependent oxidoreductase-like protein
MTTHAHPIRFGIQTGQQNVAWADMLDLWKKADAWGYDSLWNFDHFYPIFTDPEGPCFEAWTTLSALAQATSRARIGCMVNGNTYRHPCVTAKMAATLDHVSGGRLNLGIGAGWFELEHKTFGIDFKTVPGRLAALDEALRIIRGMFTQPKTTVHGRHYSVTDAMASPKPVQQPHPPIMIGGQGEKVLLRIVAEHADIWNNLGWAHRQLAEKAAVLRRHCDAVKRDFAAIEISQQTVAAIAADEAAARAATAEICRELPFLAGGDDLIIAGTPDECIERVERTRRMGATTLLLSFGRNPSLEMLELFAEKVIPAFR